MTVHALVYAGLSSADPTLRARLADVRAPATPELLLEAVLRA